MLSIAVTLHLGVLTFLVAASMFSDYNCYIPVPKFLNTNLSPGGGARKKYLLLIHDILSRQDVVCFIGYVIYN